MSEHVGPKTATNGLVFCMDAANPKSYPLVPQYSVQFNGSTQYMRLPSNSSAWTLNGDFTMEAWFYTTTTNQNGIFTMNWNGDWNAAGNGFSLCTNYVITVAGNINWTAPTTNSWHHIAAVRSGTTLTAYLDGTNVGSSTNGNQFGNSSCVPGIGLFDTNGGTRAPFPGYISNFRLVKGTALYTSNFTPPTVPLSPITNTSLFACHSSTIIDGSTNRFSITTVNGPNISQFTPFLSLPIVWNDLGGNNANITLSNSSSFDVSNRGCLVLDGSGASASLALSASALGLVSGGTMTVEAYVNINKLGDYAHIVDSSNNRWHLAIESTADGSSAYFYNGNTYHSGSSPTMISRNTWTHLVGVQDTSLLNFYINGALATNGSISSAASNLVQDGVIKLGTWQSGTRYLNGRIAIARIYNRALNAAEVSQNYNALKSRFGTNVGMVTNGMKLYLDATNYNSYSGSGTVWSDISGAGFNGVLVNGPTANSYGMVLDGINDYAYISHGGSLAFDTGNFTISVWHRNENTSSGFNGIITNDNAGDVSWKIFRDSGQAYYSARINSTVTLAFPNYTVGKFHHYAFTFNNGSVQLYFDGLPTNSTTGASNPTSNNTIAFGSYRYNDATLGNYLTNQTIGPVVLYNRALTANEILQNYNYTKPLYDPNVVSSGLALYLDAGNTTSYTGSGTIWTDLSANGNNGTLTNGPVYSSANGGAISFDGVNDFSLGPAISSISGNASRSVCIWVKSSATANTPILDFGATSGGNTTHQMYLAYNGGIGNPPTPPYNSGGVYVSFWNNDLIYPVTYTSLFNGQWHFIAYSYDASTTKLSVCFDGAFGSTGYLWNGTAWSTLSSQPFSMAAALNTTANPCYLGYARSTLWGIGGNYGNSSIANIAVYNRAISNAEILQNYNATKTIFGL